MASDPKFVAYILDQLHELDGITAKKMFGEFALYKDAKVVGLICDNQLFVKQTEGGRAYIGEPIEASAYKGAKPSFLVGGKLEEQNWLTELICITANELPEPKQKKTSSHTKTKKIK